MPPAESSIVYLDAMDVIRHRLVKDIIRAYADAENGGEGPEDDGDRPEGIGGGEGNGRPGEGSPP